MEEKACIGALVVTHGRLAAELVTAAEMIIDQEFNHVVPVGIGWHDELDEARRCIEAGLRQVDKGRGAVILTDMFGGTPANVALALQEKGRREVITGVNLPMVIKAAGQCGDETWDEFVESIEMQGRSHIRIAGEILGE